MKTTNYLYLLAGIFTMSCNLPDDLKETSPKDAPRVDMLQMEKQIQDTYFKDQPMDNTGHSRFNAVFHNVATGTEDWMKNLPDTALISTINLPGTDQSWNTGYETDLMSTQTLTVGQQLQAGIRALDIRCYNFRDAFATFYEDSYRTQLFGVHVRDVCIKFLQEHPSEFILMIVTQKGPDVLCTRLFSETFKAYTQGVEKYFYLTENLP